MDPRRRRFLIGLAGVVLPLVLVACEGPAPTGTPTAFADRPAVQLDTTWTAVNGSWTFTGQVDPEGASTDVVLEVGPGPVTARHFDTKLPVVQDLTTAGPLTITTREIPDIDEICVRFTATNSVGTSWSTPLCFPHDLPTFQPPAAPTVTIEPTFTTAGGKWTFTGRVNPGRAPTDVVLDVGSGPASAPRFTSHVTAATALLEIVTLQVTTADLPASGEACVRFTATNSLGSASTTPLCFSR